MMHKPRARHYLTKLRRSATIVNPVLWLMSRPLRDCRLPVVSRYVSLVPTSLFCSTVHTESAARPGSLRSHVATVVQIAREDAVTLSSC